MAPDKNWYPKERGSIKHMLALKLYDQSPNQRNDVEL